LELGDLQKARELAEEAIEKGREHRADFTLIARALTRIGSTYLKEEEYEKAIEYFKKSLLEHRTANTLNLQKKAETLLAEKKAREYYNPELSAQHKEEGNAFYKKQKYDFFGPFPLFIPLSSLFCPSFALFRPSSGPLSSLSRPSPIPLPSLLLPSQPSPPLTSPSYPEAIKAYSEAIKRQPDNPVNYSNRSVCYSKLMALPEALKDADKCIELDPTFGTQRGFSTFFLKI
jgi:stress-induced-phosphoprotein 1